MSMPLCYVPKICSKPKRRKINCLLCGLDAPAFDRDYRSKHNNKYHKEELANGRSIPYQDTVCCLFWLEIEEQGQYRQKEESAKTVETAVDIELPMETESRKDEARPFEYKDECMFTEGSVSESQVQNAETFADFVCCSILDTSLNFPTDPAHFLGVSVTPECTAEILDIGPCQPGKQESSTSLQALTEGHFAFHGI